MNNKNRKRIKFKNVTGLNFSDGVLTVEGEVIEETLVMEATFTINSYTRSIEVDEDSQWVKHYRVFDGYAEEGQEIYWLKNDGFESATLNDIEYDLSNCKDHPDRYCLNKPDFFDKNTDTYVWCSGPRKGIWKFNDEISILEKQD